MPQRRRSRVSLGMAPGGRVMALRSALASPLPPFWWDGIIVRRKRQRREPIGQHPRPPYRLNPTLQITGATSGKHTTVNG